MPHFFIECNWLGFSPFVEVILCCRQLCEQVFDLICRGLFLLVGHIIFPPVAALELLSGGGRCRQDARIGKHVLKCRIYVMAAKYRRPTLESWKETLNT
jgi:hypothetical protein